MSLQVFLFRVRSKKVNVGVTMNVYTHLGLEDVAVELKRIEALELARKEIEKKPDTSSEKLLFRSI